MRFKTINLLEEKVGANFHNLRFGKGFLSMTPKEQDKKSKLDWIL